MRTHGSEDSFPDQHGQATAQTQLGETMDPSMHLRTSGHAGRTTQRGPFRFYQIEGDRYDYNTVPFNDDDPIGWTEDYLAWWRSQ